MLTWMALGTRSAKIEPATYYPKLAWMAWGRSAKIDGAAYYLRLCSGQCELCTPPPPVRGRREFDVDFPANPLKLCAEKKYSSNTYTKPSSNAQCTDNFI
jgi:hypothetical protein